MPTRVFLWRLAIDFWGWSDWVRPVWHGSAGKRLGGLLVSAGPCDVRWLPRESTQAEEPGDDE